MRKHETISSDGGGATLEAVPPLCAGDSLTRDEFLRRWEQHPEIKFAELIGGIVYMPSPLTRLHSVSDNIASTWVGVYCAHTPGTEAGNNATTLMKEGAAPQPDDFLRILPEYGGQSRNEGNYVGGGAELLLEVSVSSAAIDLHQKRDLYEREGVREYVAILMYEREIRWHRLGKTGFKRMTADADGIWKSKVFPGLWLDGAAMLSGDTAKVLATLQQGLQSAEHAAFVTKLAKKKKK